jgi:hypothetical protein
VKIYIMVKMAGRSNYPENKQKTGLRLPILVADYDEPDYPTENHRERNCGAATARDNPQHGLFHVGPTIRQRRQEHADQRHCSGEKEQHATDTQQDPGAFHGNVL